VASLDQSLSGFAIPRGTISATIAANALTISIKTPLGNDPGPTEPLFTTTRSDPLTGSAMQGVAIVAPLSVVLASGSLMGVTPSTPFSLWLVKFDDSGTSRLGVINSFDGNQIYGLVDGAVASSTAEGSGAADSAGVIYSTVAVSSKPMRIIGRLEWFSGLAVAGAWSSAPDDVSLFVPGSRTPGDTVRDVSVIVSGGSTTTTTMPLGSSAPTITQGAQLSTAQITPTSRANLIENEYHFYCTHSAASPIVAGLFLNGATDAVRSSWGYVPGADATISVHLFDRRLALALTAQQFDLRAGGAAAGTFYFNQTSSLVTPLGSTLRFVRRLREVMA
jgi:hypothetical protein